ncbi:hypothetical protein JOC34_001547 [Virgibacillus halotolerans]|nr:hypothetical protein [Virgibacillus halotolerans]
MTRQWNFILENKLITVYDINVKQAKKQALEISKELQKSV